MTLSIALYIIGVAATIDHLHEGGNIAMVKIGAAFGWPIIYAVYALTLVLEAVLQILSTAWRRLAAAVHDHE